ncbi:hypothetical protein [Streptomyces sp. NBC_01450]|uniref:hypothetical protein n=1 Tax=Streptomyces sp. NBC_01450 TaxID=2903871 RepID=UPI003FCE1DA5
MAHRALTCESYSSLARVEQDAENDQFFHGQPQRVQAALTCPHTLITLPETEGAGEHWHMGAM